ncbi:S9 family peptidase [Salinimonas sp. HHU 13199]|uniref:S9 family peptidase n=1 Tax=Salinimonas profundi TaxID=2729140 RepID=A0ABR8LII5_9ALTE|nr:prolyl oligopeptidase family serine peptidase [Salinimonas profundi]MBD3584886.1 S9 family peptidase [Salinimonas profundi]
MKRSFIFLWLVISLTSMLSACQSSSGEGARNAHAEDFFRYSKRSDLSVHPEHNSVLFTRSSGDQPAAVFSYSYNDKTLTRHTGEDGVARRAIGFLPDRQGRTRVLFSQPVADGGQHIVVNDNGKFIDLTPGTDVQAKFVGWGESRHYLFVAVRYAGSDSQKVIRYRTDNFAATSVFANRHDLPVSAVSTSGRYVAGLHMSADNNDRIYVADVSYPEPVYHWLTPDSKENALTGPLSPLNFSAEGQALFFTAQSSSGRQAYAWTMRNDAVQSLPHVPGDVTAVSESESQHIGIEYVSSGRRSITVFNPNKEEVYVSPASRNSWSLHFMPATLSSNSKTMPDVVMMQADDKLITSPVRVSSKGVEYLAEKTAPPVDTVAAEKVWLSGFDGHQIPAQLYRPANANVSAPSAAVIYAHSGFDSFYSATYHPKIQHLVASGYAVLAVNYRGSAGFGEGFRQLNDGRQGQDDTRDLIQAAEYLGRQAWINADKIAVMGDKYGGFLALSAVMQSGVFKVAINCFGITNWLKFLQSVPPWLPEYRIYLQREFGDFEQHASRLYAISPALNAQKIGVPVFIAQGEIDRFVTMQQTDEFVATLEEHGVPVDYAIFKGEGHGLQRTGTAVILQQRIVAFLNTHLHDQ